MEPEKETFRFYNFTLMKLGDSPLKIHQELESAWNIFLFIWHFAGDQTFSECKGYLRDEPRSGAPRTAMNENTNTIELVMHAKADDPYISNQEII